LILDDLPGLLPVSGPLGAACHGVPASHDPGESSLLLGESIMSVVFLPDVVLKEISYSLKDLCQRVTGID